MSTALFSVGGAMAILLAAFVGAMVVTSIILVFSQWVKNNVMLLIIGIMIGYLSSSVIALLNFFATQEGVKSYMIWGMGNFSNVSLPQLPIFTIAIIVGLIGAMLLMKPLNALLLGDWYAQNLGVNVRAVRGWLLVVTGVLTAVTTAYCGPVAFIGLAVPMYMHLAGFAGRLAPQCRYAIDRSTCCHLHCLEALSAQEGERKWVENLVQQ